MTMAVAAPHGPARTLRHPTILVIEAHADTRAMIAMALRMHHYDVDVAGTAHDAIHLLRAGRYDLVMVHYGLPDRNGALLLREAAAAGLLRGAATMVLTGQPDAKGLEGFTLLRKPIDPTVLLQEIQIVLGAPPLEREVWNPH